MRLTVTALSGIEVVAPESAVALSAGESHLLAVATNTQLSIPGVVQVDVEVGQEAQTLHEGQLRAAQELARLCREHGVANLDQARAAANARADAERIRSRAVEQIRDDLRDLTLEALERKISRHAERIASYAAERGPEPALPEDLDSAQEIREQAERAASELRTQLAAVEAELAAASLVWKEADVTSAGLDAQVNAERAETDPKVFTHIHFHYRVKGNQLKADAVARAIELSKDKYCSASIMIAKTAEITYDFEIIEEV